MPGLLDDFERHVHSEKFVFDKLVTAFSIHYQFETIHPFQDGNGRVGRLRLNIMIASWCEMRHPWLHLSPYFEKNKDGYIDRLYGVSARGDWRRRLELCLHGVVSEAQDVIKRCDRLVDLKRHYAEKVPADGVGSIRLSKILEDLFVSPVIVVSRLSEKQGVTYPTALADTEKLVALGILKIHPNRYPKTPYAPEILRVSYEELPGDGS